MDYTVIITTPLEGRTTLGCATHTDVQNQIVHFLRRNSEDNYVIEVVFNV